MCNKILISSSSYLGFFKGYNGLSIEMNSRKAEVMYHLESNYGLTSMTFTEFTLTIESSGF